MNNSSPASRTAPQFSECSSADGTIIAVSSLGAGPGLLIVGGVLSRGRDYLPLARCLASQFTVHLMDRRGRGGSGPQQSNHGIADECADLTAVLKHTEATTVFGHSFGGLVALETARTDPNSISDLILYEPGVPLRGQLCSNWLDRYEQLLERGDRRAAFAWMVRENGFAPASLTRAPFWWSRLILRIVVRGHEWESISELLKENAAEHRVQALLDAPNAERFSEVQARTLLIGGQKSPHFIGVELPAELASTIPGAQAVILPGHDHLAPQRQPETVAEAICRWLETGA